MKTIAQLHAEMLDSLLVLNGHILELAQRGCDVRIQVQDMGSNPDNLGALNSKPHIVVRVTHLVPFSDPAGAEIVNFKPTLITKEASEHDS